MNDPRRAYLSFLRTVSDKARFVTSVCEGALLLAKAGLLDGYEATTHWAFIPCLKKYPKVKIVEGCPRFVVDRNRVTGGGISSGLDEAFKLVELLSSYQVAQEVQRVTQYIRVRQWPARCQRPTPAHSTRHQAAELRDPAPRLDMTGMLLPERAADEKYPILCSRSVCCLAWVVGRRSNTQPLPATATPWHRRGDGRGVPV